MSYRTLLVPCDFSPDSAAALDRAIDLARATGAKLHLLHVYHRPVEMFSPYGVALPESVVPEIRQAAERQLASELARVREAALEGETHVREGPPHRVIAEAARDLGADLIVMGTRGRTGLQHVLLGSVTERTVRAADCPVLSVKAAY